MRPETRERLAKVDALVQRQEEWRGRGRRTINLIASENVLSPRARKTLDTDFHHRYAEGPIGDREYQGVACVDELEQMCVDLTLELFGAQHAEVRGISGTIANLAIYYGLTKPGDELFTLSVPHGAHISFRSFGTAGCRGLRVKDIPFDVEKLNVDVERLETAILEERPAMVTLGGSLFLFPHPVEHVKKICEDLPTLVHYDASHVLGLVAGGLFQDPLREGADVVMGSTHKTFPGPQGAIVYTNVEKIHGKVQRAVFPGLTSSHHLWRLPALVVTLLEELEFGKEYARRIVANAKRLAHELHRRGFFVLGKDLGYTESHQVVLNVGELGNGARVAETLEKANVICNKNLIWTDSVDDAKDPSGIRLGVQEMTRFGMGESEMAEIAEIFERVLMLDQSPEKVAKDATELASRFTQVQYCFPG
ncbi:MAG: serine hydroxymethyltransferase [Promethearchaeota archaeon]